MRVVNMMLSRGGGGIEQAFLDYTLALQQQGVAVTVITHPRAWVNARLPEGVDVQHLPNRGAWDWWAAWRLRRLVRALRPDAVISHTNRGLTLLRKARVQPQVAVVAVAHNGQIRQHLQADAVFAVTEALAAQEMAQGVDSARVWVVPNMVAIPAARHPRLPGKPPVIGAMGRLVAVKGLDGYLQALKLLQDRGASFRAVLAGAGEEEAALRALAQTLGLHDCVEWTGWVDDRAAFYAGLDVFCVPSRRESFGIVVLEAWAHGVAVVSTATDGPREIATHEHNALLVPVHDPSAMADALERLLADATLRTHLAEAGATTVLRYTHEAAGARMVAALMAIVGKS